MTLTYYACMLIVAAYSMVDLAISWAVKISNPLNTERLLLFVSSSEKWFNILDSNYKWHLCFPHIHYNLKLLDLFLWALFETQNLN